MKRSVLLHIQGIVQGVGFRPFVYRQAKFHNINGWVLNAQDGVHVAAEGEENLVDDFIMSMSTEAPCASDVKTIDIKDVPLQNYNNFIIKQSEGEQESNNTLVSPDIATCEDCMRELFDENDKRYHYPFINCTNCGPRFTIIEDLPYDRSKTTMRDFKMCKFCEGEYTDPLNRRFHAQPNACFECGPHIYLNSLDGNIEWGDTLEKSDDILKKCAHMISQGKILAVKGLGGFHFVCDAFNKETLSRLRKSKQRNNKAFAVMCANIDDIKKLCYVSDGEETILKSPAKPIVLLKKIDKSQFLDELSSNLPELGIMLPYTPVQALLMDFYRQEFCGHKDDIPLLVMTSGNISDNPIIIDDNEAAIKFNGIVDAILGNNREIVTRFDDSVVRVLDIGDGDKAIQTIRRARGYAPRPIEINNQDKKFIFATGPEQKNTFCFTKNNLAYVSQHIGDMENAEVEQAWTQAKHTFEHLFDVDDKNIICDLHPEYLTTKWAMQKVITDGSNKIKIQQIQHHFAHIASILGENGIKTPVMGLAFDGTGFGMDGTIWGGEALICNTSDFERLANIAYFPLPGGASAIKNPLRIAYGLLYSCDMLDTFIGKDVMSRLGQDADAISAMIDNGINTPYTSSMGRVFDAISAILRVCEHPTYEGEAAIKLESVICDENSNVFYNFDITKNVATEFSTAHDTSVVLVDFKKTLSEINDDYENGIPVGEISKKFHNTIANISLTLSQIAYQLYGIKDVALSGGVWMNRYLIEQTCKILKNNGYNVLLNKELPPNDGCISYGESVVACSNGDKD